ncbi:MAG: AAA family ATPase [Magnetococcales bacterium]|nr:AAA family ATPase [Magnetococcales bacterium]
MKKVSVINFKGGVGKTTIAFHLACYLSRDSKVLLVDIDHQSSISLVVLGQTLWGKMVKEGLTINKLFESYCNRKINFPGDEIIVFNAMHKKDNRVDIYQNLDFVSSQFELDDTEIDLASTVYGTPAVSDWEKRTLIARWLDYIYTNGRNYDYVIFDCPPATKIVSQNAISCSDCFVIPVIPDELSTRGVTHFESLVKNKINLKLEHTKQYARIDDGQCPKNYVSKTALAAIIPFMVKQAGRAASGMTDIHTNQLNILKNRWGSAVLNTIGKNYIGVPESVSNGWPVWNWGRNSKNVKPNVIEMMDKICEELKQRVDAL